MTYHLLSGQAFFSAAVLAAAALAIDLSAKRQDRRWQVAARMGFLLAVGLGALSGTPVRWWLLLPLMAALALVLARSFRERRHRVVNLGAIALILAAALAELPWHRAPSISASSPVVILGDSLSSGGFSETRPWPARLEGVEVINLALPGETVRAAIENQLPDVPTTAGLVIVELGGNDLLGATRAAEYADELDRLLSDLREAGVQQIVMFELPLPPGRWRWGAIQRNLAREHDVPMIPKRVLARLVTDGSYADDGLHPTDAGHAMLARAVSQSLRNDHKPRSTSVK